MIRFRLVGWLVASLALLGCSAAKSGATRNEPQTVAELLGVPASADQAVAEFEAAIRRRDELLIICMREEGFDYRPPPIEQRLTYPPGFDLSPDEYAAQFGFGVLTVLELGESPGVEVAPELIPPALSDDERRAMSLALLGDGQGGGGCLGSATEESLAVRPEIEMLMPSIEELEARIGADARMIDLENDLNRCMIDRGWAVPPSGSYAARFEEISVEIRAKWESTILEALSSGGTPDQLQAPPELLAELNAARSEEIQTAIDFRVCRGRVADAMAEVRKEYEDEFLAGVSDATGG